MTRFSHILDANDTYLIALGKTGLLIDPSIVSKVDNAKGLFMEDDLLEEVTGEIQGFYSRHCTVFWRVVKNPPKDGWGSYSFECEF